jgi:hypothetical protein
MLSKRNGETVAKYEHDLSYYRRKYGSCGVLKCMLCWQRQQWCRYFRFCGSASTVPSHLSLSSVPLIRALATLAKLFSRSTLTAVSLLQL